MKIRIVKTYEAKIKEVNKEERTLTILSSTVEPDRVREYIPSDQWNLKNYEKNPVILWAHDYKQLPVAKALWSKATKEGLLQKIQFAKHAFAQEVFDAYEGGFMNAFSVGFLSGRDEKDIYKLIDCELLETSCVPVPMNAGALAQRGYKSPEMLRLIKSIEDKTIQYDWIADVAKQAEDKDTELKKAFAKELETLKGEKESLIKELESMKENLVKVGRVLSDKNRKIISTAHDALGELLDATEITEDITQEALNALSSTSKEIKTIDKKKKYVILANRREQNESTRPEILAKQIGDAIKQANIGELVRGEIRRLKGDLNKGEENA